jgi:FkbM family methyltransferase
MLKNLFNLLAFVWNHPLNRGARLAAISRVARWQIASRLMEGPIAFPFANGTYLLASRGMTGATGNWYCGLAEYEDMSFVRDILKEDDLFVDIGANIGAYSLLALGGGAEVIAIEPIPSTYSTLRRNITFNYFSDRIEALNIGLGAETGDLCFSADIDTVNHVLTEKEICTNSVTTPVRRLDDVLQNRKPLVIKIDVEGFETKVVQGAANTFGDMNLLAVIIELNGSGMRYGFDEDSLHKKILEFGFQTYRYEPVSRTCQPNNMQRCYSGNTLYIRDIGAVMDRLRNPRNID